MWGAKKQMWCRERERLRKQCKEEEEEEEEGFYYKSSESPSLALSQCWGPAETPCSDYMFVCASAHVSVCMCMSVIVLALLSRPSSNCWKCSSMTKGQVPTLHSLHHLMICLWKMICPHSPPLRQRKIGAFYPYEGYVIVFHNDWVQLHISFTTGSK